MDNYIDNLGEPDGGHEQPDNEPEYTPPIGEPKYTHPSFESEEMPEEPAFTEPQYQPETPPVSDSDDPYVMPPVPEGPNKDDKLWATFCHLAGFAGYFFPFGNVIGPLVIWLIKKDESQYIDLNGKKALNFQISMTIYTLASLVLICGGPLILLAIIPLGIVSVIFPIIAAIKANNGEEVSYPISIEFIK